MLSSRLSVISSSDLPAAAALAASSAAAAAVSVCATTIPPTPAHMDEDKQERMDDHTDNTHDSMHSTPSSVAHGSVCLSFGSGSLDRDRSGSIAAPQPPHPPHQSVEVQPATHQQRNQITGHTEQAQGEQNTNAAAAATEPVDVPQSLMSSSIATACVVSPPQPPLTPIRKRNFEEEEEKDTSESREEQTRNGATHYAAARSRSISPSSSTSSPAAAAATVSASASSSISWPWYMVTAVSGAANEAYSDFVPSNLSFGSDGLPDVEEVDWWGMGTEMSVQVAVEIAQRARMEVDVGVVAHDAIQTDESKEHEQKMDSDQASKRQRLCDQHVSPSSSSSSSPSHSRAPSDPHALNIFGSMGQDSHFCVSNSRIGCAVAGVADGVGGWRDSGIDSGQISRAIMKTARDIAFRMCMDAAAARAESGESQAEPFTLNPSEILTSAYLAVKASGKVEAGSTTACIVALTPVPVTTQADTNSKHTTRIRSNPTTAAHDMSQINLSPSVPPVTPIVSLEVAASPSTVSVSNFLYSSPAMYDLLTAMVDVNATYVASEVGHTHIEVSETTTTGVHHPVWGQLTSQPIEIPTNNPSVAIDVAPSNDTSLSPSPVRDLLAATRPLVPSEDTVYLSAANLGDSGYMILRRDSLGAYRVVQMSDLQRTGRTVKQLAIIPPRFQNDSFCDDRPEEAELDAHLVKENDILILGSDGLWDNLIAGEWNSFVFRFQTDAELERTAKQRKARMCASVESIAAQCASMLDKQRAAQPIFVTAIRPSEQSDTKESNHNQTTNETNNETTPAVANSTATPASLSELPLSSEIGVVMDLDRAPTPVAAPVDSDLDMVDSSSSLPVSTSVASPVPFDWDAYEVRLFADQFKLFTRNFMPKLEGKPDDLTILCAKIKKETTNNSTTQNI